MPDTILITGAAGFVGTHLIELLQPGPHEIVAAYRPHGSRPFEPPALRLAPDGSAVHWRPLDVLDRDEVERIVGEARPTAVYHCAGAAHVGTSWHAVAATHQLNVMGTHHVLDALRRSGGPVRVLVPGSATVYRPSTGALDEEAPIGPGSPYGLSKLAQELLAISAHDVDGLHVVVTRSFNHTGPRQSPSFMASSFARQVAAIEAGLQPPVLRVGNLQPRRDSMDVRDTVRAYRLLLEHGQPGRPYNVCSGRAHSVSDVLDALVRAAGVDVKIEPDPSLLRPNDDPIVLGDPSRLHAATGWTAETPIEDTLQDLLDYWRATLKVAARPEPGV